MPLFSACWYNVGVCCSLLLTCRSILPSSSWTGGVVVADTSAQTNVEVVSIAYQELEDLSESLSAKDNQECLPVREGDVGGDDHSQTTTTTATTTTASNVHCNATHMWNLLERLEKAFGRDGLGFLEVTDIPSDYVALRQTLLPMAQRLAQLPETELDAVTLPDTMYTIGWSHGKEQFKKGGREEAVYDTSKGSFYVDPFRPKDNVFPASWDLETPLIHMTHFMSKVGLWVANAMDLQVSSSTTMQSSVTASLDSCENAKARLLYYFPKEEPTDEGGTTSLDDWCGWHTDHGSITILLPGMIFDEESQNVSSSTTKSSGSSEGYPKGGKPAGLYIKTRSGEEVHAKLPPTSLGIQVGETVEIMSAGKYVATPHSVAAGQSAGGRASLALFLQPMRDQPLPNVPTQASESLKERWRPNFGAFQQVTIEAFQ